MKPVKMESYKGLSGNTGVTSFKIKEKEILVEFKDRDIYKYTYTSAGKEHIENMKRLALQGKGLSTYISQNVKGSYAEIVKKGEIEPPFF